MTDRPTGHPLIIRTSPKGAKFIGRCDACGKTGLSMGQINEPCPNPSGMTQEDALLKAIKHD